MVKRNTIQVTGLGLIFSDFDGSGGFSCDSLAKLSMKTRWWLKTHAERFLKTGIITSSAV